MPMPFDATLKDLLETRPADWPRWFGLPVEGPVELADADVSTVTAAADKVLWVRGPVPYILHMEFTTHRDLSLLDRLHLYNAMLYHRHRLPVHSAVLLLRREADVADLNGVLLRYGVDGRRYLEFRYDVLRLWQAPVEPLLTGGLTQVVLAPLSDEAQPILPDVVRRMQERLMEAAPELRAKFWTATYVLMGLRYPRELAEQVLQGVLAMEESVTYQAIITKGRTQEARAFLLRQGRIRFGVASSQIESAIQAIADLERLERLGDRLVVASSWQELLETP